MRNKRQYLGLYVILSSALFAYAAFAQSPSSSVNPVHDEHNTTAVHGMVLFGTQQLYISHLGLYHPPHDRQIVAAVEIFHSDHKRHFDKLRENYKGLITIAPKAFPLANLAPGSSSFQSEIIADVYKGHFERGGKKALSDVALSVQKPIIYQPLDAKQALRKQAQFWQLGQGDSAFIIYKLAPHRIKTI